MLPQNSLFKILAGAGITLRSNTKIVQDKMRKMTEDCLSDHFVSRSEYDSLKETVSRLESEILKPHSDKGRNKK